MYLAPYHFVKKKKKNHNKALGNSECLPTGPQASVDVIISFSVQGRLYFYCDKIFSHEDGSILFTVLVNVKQERQH